MTSDRGAGAHPKIFASACVYGASDDLISTKGLKTHHIPRKDVPFEGMRDVPLNSTSRTLKTEILCP